MSVVGCNDTFNVVITPSILKAFLKTRASEELLDFLYLNNDIIVQKRKDGVI